MTQQQALHACLTHSRNEIITQETTSTRIVYRAPAGPSGHADVVVYEGVLPDTVQSTAGQEHPRPAAGSSLPNVTAAASGAGSEAGRLVAAAPTVVPAPWLAPPRSAALRYRVCHQPLENADHAYQRFDEDPFTVQTSSLGEALQLERLLEAYDTSQERHGEHDIEIWTGTAWSPWADLDPGSRNAGYRFLERLDDLDDAGTLTVTDPDGVNPSSQDAGAAR